MPVLGRFSDRLHVPLANLVLRLASLVGKFGLSIFIARFLDLAELGVYGIVFALSMFMVVFLSGRIDHELGRLLVLQSKDEAARLQRDETVFFLLNFALALPLFLIAGSLGMAGFGLRIALCTWAICCLENYANLMFVNTNVLGKPMLANVAFFIRSGLWAFAAMAALLFWPGLRSLWTVLLLWIAGSALSIWMSLEILDVRRWPSFRRVPIGWRTLGRGLRISFLIWIGSIGLAGGTYLDRVVLSGYLDLRTVGVATFYTSFSSAVVTLVSSSCIAVVMPKLVRLADEKDWPGFRHELWSGIRSAAFIGLPLCLGIAVLIPYLGFILQKPEFYANRMTLWALMFGAMLRLIAEGLYAGLYARRLDVPIWLGNILFLAISLIANIFFIAMFGLQGLGIANVLVAVFLLAFRLWGLMTSARVAGAAT
jgi:O-antigen/teichoic acid export membrane protein